ncbi:hypothetical protein VCHA30O60_50100 [Vibrio chagasii]|nr:hypothetical protein VCHA30O60_50100 [Vibrio chagasii]
MAALNQASVIFAILNTPNLYQFKFGTILVHMAHKNNGKENR